MKTRLIDWLKIGSLFTGAILLVGCGQPDAGEPGGLEGDTAIEAEGDVIDEPDAADANDLSEDVQDVGDALGETVQDAAKGTGELLEDAGRDIQDAAEGKTNAGEPVTPDEGT